MQRLLNYNYIYLIPLLFSAILSLKSFRLKWPKPYKIFSVLLLSTLAIEVFAIAWKWGLHETNYWNFSHSNLWIYNAFLLGRHLFLLSFFYQVIVSTTVRKIILWSVVPFLLFAIANYQFIQTPHYVNTYTIILANTVTIMLSLTFFYQILNDNNLTKLYSNSIVWISLGSFIYYSGTLPFFLLFNYLIKENIPMALSYLYINTALNTIMYTCFLISFLCKPHHQK